MALETTTCGEVLYHGGTVAAACTQPFGVEHSHSDWTAWDAVRAGTAVPIPSNLLTVDGEVTFHRGEVTQIRVDTFHL